MNFPIARITMRLSRAVAVGLLLIFAGCGSSGQRAVPVHGKITLGGGAWPKPGVLYFTSIEPAPGFTRHPGTAKFEKDGTFVVSTVGVGDGLYPGKYGVAVECWEIPPSMDAKAPPRRGVAESKFESARSSGLTLDVPVGSGPIHVDFDAAPRK
jgi:hypothetical protein